MKFQTFIFTQDNNLIISSIKIVEWGQTLRHDFVGLFFTQDIILIISRGKKLL